MAKPQTYISQLVHRLKESLEELDAQNLTFPALESMAILIHESMSHSSRNYHSVRDVFEISVNVQDPLVVVAAMFHDVIYYHVDGCLTKAQSALLKGTYKDPGHACTHHLFVASSF